MAWSEKEFIRSFLGMHRQMERVLDETFRHGSRPPAGDPSSWSPPADVYETAEGFLVRLEIGGLDLENLHVTFDDGCLTVEGRRCDLGCTESVVCHQMEIPYGPFRRELAISRDVDAAGITAHYADGLLTIRLPRSGGGSGRRKVRIEAE